MVQVANYDELGGVALPSPEGHRERAVGCRWRGASNEALVYVVDRECFCPGGQGLKARIVQEKVWQPADIDLIYGG